MLSAQALIAGVTGKLQIRLTHRVDGGGCHRRHRGHSRSAPGARVRTGHHAPLGALGRFHPRVGRRAQAANARSGESAGGKDPVRDDQRQRPTAPHHCGRAVGLRRRHLQLPVQLGAPLPERRHRRQRRRERAVEGGGWLLRGLGAVLPGQRQVALGAALDRRQRRRVPEVVAEGGGGECLSQDVGRGAQALRRAQEEGQAVRTDARPHVR